MFMNDRRMSQELDNHITGHGGEDQFRGNPYDYKKRQERNRIRRERNQMLRDLCGTSAKAAREDMGLGRY